MKNKKWISLAAAVILAVTALPMTAFAAEKDGGEEKLTKVTLNEVAHSIFYAPQYVAIEEGYFSEEGLDLTLITGFGADKVLTALISGEADIGFMGAEASIYAYQEGATDPVVNFAQLTQRAGNFLVAREEMPDFKWEDLKGMKDEMSFRLNVLSRLPEMKLQIPYLTHMIRTVYIHLHLSRNLFCHVISVVLSVP